MYKPCLFLVALAVTALSLVGCEDEQSASQKTLDEAMAVLEVAQQGFMPIGEEKDLQSFRQTQLAQSQARLREVIATGSISQKKMANQLLAEVQLSAARYLTRDAMAEYAKLSARTPVLVEMVKAAERAATQVDQANVDYDPQLAQLAAGAKALAGQNMKLQAEADSLNAEIQAEQSQLDAQNTNAAKAMAQARVFLDEAFVADGDRQMKLQDDATAAERQAAIASAQAEKHQIQIDLLNSQRSLAMVQIETLTSQIQGLKAQAEQTRELQASTAATLASAEQFKLDAAGQLKKEFDQLAKVHHESVSQPLADAADRVKEAVALFSSTGGAGGSGGAGGEGGSGGGGQDLLLARVDQAHVNTERAIATAGWAHVTALVAAMADEASLPDAAGYQGALTELKADYITSLAQATESITAGRELAADAGEDEAASEQAKRLSNYEQRLAKSEI